MDYDDNDFEGHEFHLAGEDSSKVSSVLRPFPLPKFDFDGSINGHLRFDSLDENEAFFGIPSHQDNNWMEEFSRPEMLLKAVVQEETNPDENLIQDSSTLNEQGTSTEEMDNPLMKCDTSNDFKCGNSSLPPTNIEGDFSTPIHRTGVVGILAENNFGSKVLECSCEALVGAGEGNLVTVTESSIMMLKTDRELEKACAIENEAASIPVSENFPVQGKLIDKKESTSQEIDAIMESTVKNEDLDRTISVEIDTTERDCSVRLPSEEEFRVKIPDSVCEEAPSNDADGASVVEIDISKDVAVDTEIGGYVSHGTMILSSATDVNQVSEDGQKDASEVDDLFKSKSPTITDKFSREESMLDVEQDSRNINTMQESAMGHDHDCNVMADTIRQPSTGSTLNLSYDGCDKILASSAEASEMLHITGAELQCPEAGNRDPGGGTPSQAPNQTGTLVVESLCSNETKFDAENVVVHDSVAVETMKGGEANYFSENPSVLVPNEPSGEVGKKMESSNNGSVVIPKGASAEIEKKVEKEVESNDKGNNFSVGHSGMEQNKTIETSPDTVCDVDIDKQNPIQGNNIEIDKILMDSEPSEVYTPHEEGRGVNDNDRHMVPQSRHDFGKYASGSNEADDSMSNVVSNFSFPTPSLGSSSEDLRASSNRKSRHGSSKSIRGGAKREKQMKETTPVRQAELMQKSSHFVSPFGSGHIVNIDASINPRGAIPIAASGLPDRNNTSSPSPALFRQPFTDLQQVQLRAQIIVYGSLIQGAAPDEACMFSAFDGDRDLWERSWRACVDRLQVGKLKGNIVEAFSPAGLDAKAPDHVQRQGFSEGEVLSSAAAHARKKGAASPIVNPMIPLSSPLWTMPTVSGDSHPPISIAKDAVDHQIVSSLNHYQSPHVRNYAAHSGWSTLAPLPWPTQSSPFDFKASHPAFPIPAQLKPSPITDPSLPAGIGSQHFSPILTTAQPGAPIDLFPGPSTELKKLKVSTTRKMKKSNDHEGPPPVSGSTSFVDASPTSIAGNYSSKTGCRIEDSGKIAMIPHSRGDPTSVTGSHHSASVTDATPNTYLPKGSTNPFSSLNPPSVSGDTLKRVDLAVHSRSVNVEGFKKAEEATRQAQQAEGSAASAVAYCESVWSQLGLQSTSHLDLDIDSRLAQAAAALAAAASVAKAAAAAAKIAENIAAHEKQMFEEAIIISQTAEATAHDASLTNVSHASLFNDLNLSTSGIGATREAARKRVEAASAAKRHAENLDAILRAAELAAEAVSHAGKIVAMTNPLSSRKLVEAGPDNYWKDPQLDSRPVLPPNDKGQDLFIHEDSGVASDVYRSQQEGPDELGASGIKEGSRVEVLRDSGDSKRAWFSATVLGFREGEVLVCYADVLSGEGSEQLKEWVSMVDKDNTAPRVRAPHPLSSVPHERAKKRPRDALKDCHWSLGDKVDAWIKNCWCEGTVAENKKDDESTLRVKFSDQEETALVKVWHLRPKLYWNGVRWVEVPKSGSSNNSCKGDTPAQKRPKIASTVSETAKKGKLIEGSDPAGAQRTQVPSLPSSAQEQKICEVDGNRSKSFRGMRFGLEKERSRVVFGVPKPGKKRKFMEVSKHYVSEPRVASNPSSGSVGLTRFLKPHGQSSQTAKTGLKAEVKETQAFDTKTRSSRSAVPRSNPGRALPRKDYSTTSSKPDECDGSLSDHVGKSSVSGTGSELGDRNSAEHETISNQEEDSGDAVTKAVPHVKHKKVPPRHGVPEQRRPARRNIPVPSGRPEKEESNDTQVSDGAEPRRSVRRIQPTSRLLEGLQTSLILSKLPPASHKGPGKAPTARGNNDRGG